MSIRCCRANRALFVVMLSGMFPLLAQVSGTVTGTVVDPSGKIVVGGTVTLTNDLTSDSRSLATSGIGVFTFPAVQPGQYSIRIEHPGFKVYERMNVNLAANEVLALGQIELTVGMVTETVSVTAQGSLVESNSSEHSALLTSDQTEDLQVRGRDNVSLLKLLPGVTNISDEEALGGTFGSTTPNIEGNRTNTNAVSVDGLAVNDGGAPGSVSPVNLDAVQEVKVLLNNYQAEYGRNGGAEIRLVTKSGTKNFHGTGYWYKRHEEFNANSWANNKNGVAKPIYRYNDDGFTLGGPVYIPRVFNKSREKLFFFYSFDDWQGYSPQALVKLTMPTLQELGGDFSQTLDTNGKLIPIKIPQGGGTVYSGNIIPPSLIDQNGLALLKILKQPNLLNRAITGGNYNFTFQESLQLPKQQNLARGDWNPTARDRISVRWSGWLNAQNGYSSSTGLSNWGLGTSHYRYTDNGGTLNYTRIISPNMVNEFSGGVRHSIESLQIDSSQLAKVVRSDVGFNVGQLYPALNPLDLVPVTAFTGVISNGPSISYDPRFPLYGADTNFDFTDGLTWVKSKHTLKAGIYVNRLRSRKGFRAAFAGNLSFSPDVNNASDAGDPFANALLGNFTNYNESSSRVASQARTWDIEWYLQDTFKATRRLTIDYGLRMTFSTPLVQECACSANLQNAEFSAALYNRANAPQLLVPQVNPATKARQAYNPLTGQYLPAPLIGFYAPNSGNPFNGMILGTDTKYPTGFQPQRPVQWGPRLGFAYDVFGNGSLAVRGGAGILYQTRPATAGIFWNLPLNPPIQINPNIYYSSLSTLLTTQGYLSPPGSVYGYDPGYKTPTSYDLTLGIQKTLPKATLLDVAYVGTFGRHLIQSVNINQIAYGAHFAAQNIDPTNNKPLPDNFLRPDPGYGSIVIYNTIGTSSYNALQVSANRRFAKSVQYGIAYTYSKAMDLTDGEGGLLPTYQSLRRWAYGKAGFDQTHNFVLNYVWSLPKATNLVKNRMVGLLFDNWQLSGVVAFVSGQPLGVSYTTTDNADITGGGDGARIDVTGRAELPFGQRDLTQFFNTSVFVRPAKRDAGNAPKDIFRGPGTANGDAALAKVFPLGKESRNLQFRWEAYNALNHTQPSTLDTTARFDPTGAQVNPTFGQITGTRSARVMQGSLRFRF
jgi:hypothetical protein